jgi:DNA-binding NarL/FixJ family response regulator
VPSSFARARPSPRCEGRTSSTVACGQSRTAPARRTEGISCVFRCGICRRASGRAVGGACVVFGKALEQRKPGLREETEILGTTPLILVADGDEVYRAQVTTLLERIGCETIAAADGRQALEIAIRERPALVLLEINLSGASGYEVCRELREAFDGDISIIFVSGERTEPYDRVAGLLLGADDYIVKPFDDGELLARVRSTLRHSDTAPRATGNGSKSSMASLTAREREVLQLLAHGFTQVDIAGKLVISPKTVGTHIQRILGKLGVHSRAQAVVLAHEQGLAAGNGDALADAEGHILTAHL